MKARPPHFCRLCLHELDLVQSHIIPAFQFKPLKKGDGRYYQLSTDPAKREQPGQRGFTERLLCAKCDNVRIQRNEDYFARLWNRGPLEAPQQHGPFLIFREYEYKRVKNCLLSILWRMSLSTHKTFGAVSLGKKHEEILRAGLLADREFAEDEYAVTVTAPFFEGEFFADLILPPDSHRMDGNRIYRCVIAGMLYTFVVGSARIAPALLAMSLRKEEFPVARMEVKDIPFLADAVGRIGRAQATREAHNA